MSNFEVNAHYLLNAAVAYARAMTRTIFLCWICHRCGLVPFSHASFATPQRRGWTVEHLSPAL